jgi:hypothetical protein
MIISFLKGKDQYLYFTIGCTVIALLSIGLTYSFPFREQRSGGVGSSVLKKSQTLTNTKFSLSQADYSPHSYHGNPKDPLKLTQEPLIEESSEEEDEDIKKEKKKKKKNEKDKNKS